MSALIRSPQFIRDVESIVQYLLEQQTPRVAIKFGKAVTKALDLLSAFPEIGSPWKTKKYVYTWCDFRSFVGSRST